MLIYGENNMSVQNVDSNKSCVKPMVVGASAGTALGVLKTRFDQKGAKVLLNRLNFDSFDSVLKHIKDENKGNIGLLNSKFETFYTLTKDKLKKIADKAFKTTGKTYTKNALIGAGIGVALSTLFGLAKSNKKEEKE